MKEEIRELKDNFIEILTNTTTMLSSDTVTNQEIEAFLLGAAMMLGLEIEGGVEDE